MKKSLAVIAALAACGILPMAQGDALAAAHATLLQRSLDCTLDRRPRVVALDAAIASARMAVREACDAQGLVFDAGAAKAAASRAQQADGSPLD